MSQPLPTSEQIAAAAALDVDLHFANTPLAVARLCEVVERLQQKVAALEEQQKTGASGWSLRRK